MPKELPLALSPQDRLRLVHANRDELAQYGRILEHRPESLCGQNVLTMLARELLRVRTRDGPSRPLHANRVQIAFEDRQGPRNIVLKSRQMGLTTWAAARFFLKTITQPGSLTLEVAQTQEAAEEIFRIVRRFLDEMPEPLRAGPLRTSRNSVRRISFPQLDSQYLVVSAGDRNAGRGLTIQNLHCSELARWPGNPAETLAGLRAALSPGGGEILESTPRGVGDCFHVEWRQAAESGIVQHFFPWWMELRYRATAVDLPSLTEEERALVERAGLDLRQIAFRRTLQANFRGLAQQEYAEDSDTCFLTSGDLVFELGAIEERMQHAPEPVEQKRNGELQVWLPPVTGRRYLVAVDPAGGGSDGDYSAAQVLEVETGLQCAEFAGHLGGLALTELVTGLAKLYNGALLVVERNNQGAAILAMAETSCQYENIYRLNGKAGWLTTALTKPTAVGRLAVWLTEQTGCFQSRRLLAECRSFVYLPNGGTGARAGAHDDCVMAMAIGLSVREEMLLKRL